MTDWPAPTRINFHLVDRQIVDSAGEPVGKVDDLELTIDADATVRVTALLCGQQVLGERIRGRLGRAIAGIARRLRSDVPPAPPPEQDAEHDQAALRIPLHHVAEVGPAIRLSIRREILPKPPLERWLGEHVIDRIPGAGRADQ